MNSRWEKVMVRHGRWQIALALLASVLLGGARATRAASPQDEAAAPNLESKLRQEVPDYTLTAGTFLQALARIAAEFRVPMGIVLVGSPEASRGVQMSWHRVTVKQGLDLLVKSYPGYELDVRGEVLHVRPTAAPPDQRDFLSVAMPAFAGDDNLMTDDNQLREAVNRTLFPDGHAHFSRSFERGSEQYRKFRIENATVREILDRFLLASDDYKVWVVVYPTQPSLTRTGFRRTLSPFDFRLPPDEEQPVWAIFLWGYDPVAHLFNFDWLKGASTAAAAKGGWTPSRSGGAGQ